MTNLVDAFATKCDKCNMVSPPFFTKLKLTKWMNKNGWKWLNAGIHYCPVCVMKFDNKGVTVDYVEPER